MVKKIYQFNRIPFGLKIGSQAISLLMTELFHDLTFVWFYIDDLIIFSKDWESHIEHLEVVFTRMRQSGLTVNPEKIQVGTQQLNFMGHIISLNRIRINPERVEALCNMERPKNLNN